MWSPWTDCRREPRSRARPGASGSHLERLWAGAVPGPALLVPGDGLTGAGVSGGPGTYPLRRRAKCPPSARMSRKLRLFLDPVTKLQGGVTSEAPLLGENVRSLCPPLKWGVAPGSGRCCFYFPLFSLCLPRPTQPCDPPHVVTSPVLSREKCALDPRRKCMFSGFQNQNRAVSVR